jgi:hypothetical protein
VSARDSFWAAAGMLAQAPGAVLLSRVSDRRQFLVPQSLIDDPPAFRFFLLNEAANEATREGGRAAREAQQARVGEWMTRSVPGQHAAPDQGPGAATG